MFVKKFAPAFFVVFFSAAAIICLTWGFYYNWPDYVHVDYGVPLTWATHTISTISGPPAAPWKVDVVALQMDLIFWLGLVAASAITGRVLKGHAG